MFWSLKRKFFPTIKDINNDYLREQTGVSIFRWTAGLGSKWGPQRSSTSFLQWLIHSGEGIQPLSRPEHWTFHDRAPQLFPNREIEPIRAGALRMILSHFLPWRCLIEILDTGMCPVDPCRGGAPVSGHLQRLSSTRTGSWGPLECRTGVPDFNHGNEESIYQNFKGSKGNVCPDFNQDSEGNNSSCIQSWEHRECFQKDSQGPVVFIYITGVGDSR